MDLFSSMRVSSSGLDAQTKRLNTISSNIANAETTRGIDGGPYKRKDPILAAQVDRESFGEILGNELEENVQGVSVIHIQEDTRPAKLVYNPKHPDANKEGYVALPHINPVEEMANMMSAQRAFEANATAMNAAKAMAQKSLEIGR
jgi:flagellar basal-body rod protein FlgC